MGSTCMIVCFFRGVAWRVLGKCKVKVRSNYSFSPARIISISNLSPDIFQRNLSPFPSSFELTMKDGIVVLKEKVELVAGLSFVSSERLYLGIVKFTYMVVKVFITLYT